MPEPFTCAGGAQIGWANASRPLARLDATAETLTISVWILGTYRFARDDVASIECHSVWLFGEVGIKIRHTRLDCPERVLFGSSGKPGDVLAGIQGAGFLPAAPLSSIPLRPGMALRWSAAILIVLVWNALFLTEIFHSPRFPPLPVGPFALLAMTLMVALCLGALRFPFVQRLLLKPDRQIGELRPYLQGIIFIVGMMLIVFSILYFSGVLGRIPEFRFPRTR
jgi:hypothetical protein